MERLFKTGSCRRKNSDGEESPTPLLKIVCVKVFLSRLQVFVNTKRRQCEKAKCMSAHA